MAILFDAASSEYIEFSGTPPVVAAPFTMGCWFNSNDNATEQTLMMVGDKDAVTDIWRMVLRGNIGGDPLTMQVIATSSTVTDTTGGYTTNTWQHACMVVAAADNRSIYLNGGNKASSVVSRAPANADRLSIGRLGYSSPAQYMSGLIAEAGIWNVALSDAEVAMLALGASPLLVRPEALVYYLPMIALGSTTQQDWVGGRVMTEANTPVTAAHPPNIFYPAQYTVGYGVSTPASVLSGSLRFTGMMSATPLAANYGIYASDVPKRTFVSR